MTKIFTLYTKIRIYYSHVPIVPARWVYVRERSQDLAGVGAKNFFQNWKFAKPCALLRGFEGMLPPPR